MTSEYKKLGGLILSLQDEVFTFNHYSVFSGFAPTYEVRYEDVESIKRDITPEWVKRTGAIAECFGLMFVGNLKCAR